jgi:hypothetical protein
MVSKMNTQLSRPKTWRVLAAVLLATAVGDVTAQMVQQAKSVSVRGRVWVKKQGKTTSVPLHGSDPLYGGDVVRTETGGSAVLLFSDRSLIRLESASAVQIAGPGVKVQGRTALCTLLQGKLGRSRIRPNAGAATPSGTLWRG